MRDSELFEKAVAQFFEPIARNIGLPLLKVQEGVYDMPSSHFIMRIRLDTGHARGLNVMMRLATYREFSDDDFSPGVMYGIGCFIDHSGGIWQNFFNDVDSDETFLRRAELLAEASKRFLVPYLLGQRDDFQIIKAKWDVKAKEAADEVRSRRFPSFVQRRWNLPPEPFDKKSDK